MSCETCGGYCLKCGRGHRPNLGEPDCPGCHLCFDCAVPTCEVCGLGPEELAKMGMFPREAPPADNQTRAGEPAEEKPECP